MQVNFVGARAARLVRPEAKGSRLSGRLCRPLWTVLGRLLLRGLREWIGNRGWRMAGCGRHLVGRGETTLLFLSSGARGEDGSDLAYPCSRLSSKSQRQAVAGVI